MVLTYPHLEQVLLVGLQKDQKVCLYQSSHKTSHAMNHIKASSVRSFQGDHEVV
ncbi:hypothetical protein DsansV1_C20g0165401 [Dioscorea sansibarensis]